MHTKSEIINLALANLSNTNFIQDVDEKSPEAMLAAQHWDTVLQGVLAEYPWGFATVYAYLAIVDGDRHNISPHAFNYAYPSNCVILRRVFADTDNTRSYPYRVGRSHISKTTVIMTDAAKAVAEYTTCDIPPSDMPAQFVQAFAWRLSAILALGNRADPNLAAAAMQSYAVHLEQAKIRDASENGPAHAAIEWIGTRNG